MRVGLVGATGAVGEELLKVLHERRFPVDDLRAFGSGRGARREVVFAGRSVPVEAVSAETLASCDVVFLSAGAAVSRDLREVLRGSGARVYDNTSAFRMDPEVPLVVPEVNGEEAANARWVAVPNCTAILLVLALGPLHREFDLRRVVVATYQAASGAGRLAVERMLDEVRAELSETPLPRGEEAPPLAFNVVPAIGAAESGALAGTTGEEAKVMAETRRILGHPELSMVVTCSRVPVVRAHSEAVTVELAERPSLEAVRETLGAAPGVELRDDLLQGIFPTPREAEGGEGILVGRLRSGDAPGCFAFFLSGDQLRKGAALNAVQIAESQLDLPGLP